MRILTNIYNHVKIYTSHLKNDTLAYHLYQFLIKNEGWHNKYDLYGIAHREEYSLEGAGRALRKMAENKIILVDYYKGKRKQKLAKYSALPIKQKPLPTYTIVTMEDGRRKVIQT